MIIEGMPKRNVRRKAEKKIVIKKEPKKKRLGFLVLSVFLHHPTMFNIKIS